MKCYINGKEFDTNFVLGNTFSEEYNETLDSGTIIIDQVPKMELNPYDDVFIYEGKFKGYTSHKTEIVTTNFENDILNKTVSIDRNVISILNDVLYVGQNVVVTFKLAGSSAAPRETEATLYVATSGTNIGRLCLNISRTEFTAEMPFTSPNPQDQDGKYILYYNSGFPIDSLKIDVLDFVIGVVPIEYDEFYKHLLIDQFSEERINPVKNLYKYKIQLFSEIKKWETIALPNVSTTQPLKIEKKKSVYEYLEQFLDLYGTKIKRRKSDIEWYYDSKYVLSDELEEIFGNVYCPDFSLTNPSLRDLFNQLFLVKDCIPYVHDDVVYALNISQTHGTFSTNKVTSVVGSKSSENYADNLKRTYQNALSEENTARRIEYLGFRNSSAALMTLENMRVETRYPIYRINKMYMCYYKKIKILNTDTEEISSANKVFLCKQDITPLVKLEQERQVSSQDWNDFENSDPKTIEELAKYKLCTVGYSIGGNTIEGWGTQYTYPKGWWGSITGTKTYIQNIFTILDRINPFGIYSIDYISDNLSLSSNEVVSIEQTSDALDELITPYQSVDDFGDEKDALKLKSFFFEVDYEGFYAGTVIHTKDNLKDDITINDNSSNSLMLLEKDGIYQKEKINRFGNMAYTIVARYDDISEIQPLGSLYDGDVVIYHREYQIFPNFILCTYYGTKDYVLRNYFTSVYAKHRPYSLIDYGNSINRAENQKIYVMLSRNSSYYEDLDYSTDLVKREGLGISNFASALRKILSFWEFSPQVIYKDKFIYRDKINVGIISTIEGDYLSDLNVFVSGTSLCFNVAMKDNISMGQYVKDRNPFNIGELTDYEDDYTGSVLDFYSIIDDPDTGFIDNLTIKVGHIDDTEEFNNIVFDYINGSENYTATYLYSKLDSLPLYSPTGEITNQIGNIFSIHKDNKEVIDMTFQIEAISKEKDIFFSEWLMKLSDLYGVYNKVDYDYYVSDGSGAYSLETYFSVVALGNLDNTFCLAMTMKIGNNELNNIINDINNIYKTSLNYIIPVESGFYAESHNIGKVAGMEINLNNIVYVDNAQIAFSATLVTKTRGWFGKITEEASEITLRLEKITRFGADDFSLDQDHVYFSNIITTENPVTHLNVFITTGTNPFPYGYYKIGGEKSIMTTNDSLVSDSTYSDRVIATMYSYYGSSPNQYWYYRNMFLRSGTEKITEQLVFNEYDFNNNPLSLSADTQVGTVFYITTDGLGRPYLRIRLSSYQGTLYETIEMWYNDRGTLKFVFGVNLTDEDKQSLDEEGIKIYLSMFKKKDPRVFGSDNLVIGNIKNYLGQSTYTYGEKQLYDEDEEE